MSTVTCRRRPSDPWFDQECRLKKRHVHRLERIAISRRTPDSTSEWTKERRAYRSLLRSKREFSWMQKVDAQKSSPRQLWRSIDILLGRGSAPPVTLLTLNSFMTSLMPRLVVYVLLLTVLHRHRSLSPQLTPVYLF